ncbi:MAG TPA: hypothetical protein VMT64_09785, partial [Candidatus Binataceae bacterium]|nr:hypothetical protein [Candidatus Binataceae bacterium]
MTALTMETELIDLCREAIRRCELDLSGLTILTEAASGAYAATAILAAMAGATRVFALARDSRYGSVAQVTEELMTHARNAGVEERISIVTDKTRGVVEAADIITNSGHVRPIDRDMIAWMKPTAVVPLMYEAWELRAADIDVAACAARGIAVAGTNEQHHAVDVFSFLGPVAERLLADAGITLQGSRIVVLCDNSFREFIVRHFEDRGATVEGFRSVGEPRDGIPANAILLAMTPRPDPVIGREEAEVLAGQHPG